jgi:quercetin dioxygenase-like cupin family protein
MPVTIVTPPDRDLQPVGGSTAPADEQIKLGVIADGEPYVHLAEVPPGHVIAPHSHSQAEVTIVLSGSMTVGDRVCGPGTVIVIPSDEEYGLVAGTEEPLVFAVVRPRRASYRFAE